LEDVALSAFIAGEGFHTLPGCGNLFKKTGDRGINPGKSLPVSPII
jgi:hypothetical protein